jgi:hypothetical protein
MSIRNDYEELFVSRGISRQEVCSMTDAEFQKTLDYFLNERQSPHDSHPYAGVASQYRYVSAKLARARPPPADDFDDDALRRAIASSLEDQRRRAAPAHDSARADAGAVRAAQDREYREAYDDAQQQDFDARNAAIYQTNAALIAEERQQERECEVVRRYYSLPAEPARGTTIAVHVNGERCVRRFDPARRAADVYSWVAGQTIHSDEGKLYFDEFEVLVAGGGVVDPEKTLDEQGLRGRVMLQIAEV